MPPNQRCSARSCCLPSSSKSRIALSGRFHHRRPQHLLDTLRAGRQHNQPVEAKCTAARLRHTREGGKKVLVQRITLAIHTRFLRHLKGKTPALLGGIGEFPKSIGDFYAADIKLEPL